MLKNAKTVLVGNRILQGDVLDTNSHWPCVHLTHLGGTIQRELADADITVIDLNRNVS